MYKYRDLSNRHFGDPEIFSKPLVLFMGPWSGGKSTILNYLTDNEYTANSIRSGEVKHNLGLIAIILNVTHRRRTISSLFQYSDARRRTRSFGWNPIGCRLDILGTAEIRARPDGSPSRSEAPKQAVGTRKLWPRATKIARKCNFIHYQLHEVFTQDRLKAQNSFSRFAILWSDYRNISISKMLLVAFSDTSTLAVTWDTRWYYPWEISRKCLFAHMTSKYIPRSKNSEHDLFENY